MKEAIANWTDENTLVCSEEFDWPTPHTRTNTMTKVDPLHPNHPYWCAIGGQCFALLPTQDSKTCLASVQTALRHSGMPRNNDGWISDDIYVTFQLQNPTLATWERWQKKWAKRTAIRQVA